MTRILIGAALVLLLAAVCAFAAMARLRGRDSRYYHTLSSVVSPITRLATGTAGPTIPVPFSADLSPDMKSPWKWFQPDMVEVLDSQDSLSIAPTRESLWWMNQRGPMVYRHLDGDATIVLSVRTRKRSDDTSPPDMEWQFAGVILRDPRSDALLSRENYVFNVVGHRGHGLQVETKSTRQGQSQVDAWDWKTGDAQLMIQRAGSEFRLQARPDDSQKWQHLTSYDRPDLPQRLQLGLIAYAWSEGRGRFDLKASFEQLDVH